MKVLLLAALAVACAAGTAQARGGPPDRAPPPPPVVVPDFSPSATSEWLIRLGRGQNDCGGQGGFSNCFAFQGGTQQGAPTDASLLASRAVFKINAGSGGTEAATGWPSIDGTEFSALRTGNSLAISYTPGLGDPGIFYVAVKQAREFILLYYSGGFTSDVINLAAFDKTGWSHVTWFNGAPIGTGPNPGGDPAAVPVPGALALLGAGLLGLGAAVRRQGPTVPERKVRRYAPERA